MSGRETAIEGETTKPTKVELGSVDQVGDIIEGLRE